MTICHTLPAGNFAQILTFEAISCRAVNLGVALSIPNLFVDNRLLRNQTLGARTVWDCDVPYATFRSINHLEVLARRRGII